MGKDVNIFLIFDGANNGWTTVEPPLATSSLTNGTARKTFLIVIQHGPTISHSWPNYFIYLGYTYMCM